MARRRRRRGTVLSSGGGIRQLAQDRVNMQYGAKEGSLNRALERLKSELQRGSNAQKEFGVIGDQKIGSIYDALGRQMQENVGRTKGIYDQGTSQIQSAYDQSGMEAQKAAEMVKQTMGQNASNLGLEAAIPAAQAPVVQAQAQGMTDIAQGRAAALGNIGMLGTRMTGAAQDRVGQVQQEGAGRRADLQSQIAAALSQLELAYGDDQGDILGQLVDLAGEKGSALNVAMQEIAAEQAAAAREAQKMAMEKARFDREMNAEADPLELLKMQLGIEGMGLENELKRKKLSDPGQAGRMKGLSGLEAFFNTDTDYWGQTAGPKFRKHVMDEAVPTVLDSINMGDKPGWAIQDYLDKGTGNKTIGKINPEALRKALEIYFGSY